MRYEGFYLDFHFYYDGGQLPAPGHSDHIDPEADQKYVSSVMTVPTIFSITDRPVCGAMAMAAACVTAWFTSNLFLSASAACLAAFVCCLF